MCSFICKKNLSFPCFQFLQRIFQLTVNEVKTCLSLPIPKLCNFMIMKRRKMKTQEDVQPFWTQIEKLQIGQKILPPWFLFYSVSFCLDWIDQKNITEVNWQIFSPYSYYLAVSQYVTVVLSGYFLIALCSIDYFLLVHATKNYHSFILIVLQNCTFLKDVKRQEKYIKTLELGLMSNWVGYLGLCKLLTVAFCLCLWHCGVSWEKQEEN